MSTSTLHFAFLSTIDAPLLPLFLDSAIKQGVTNISVICDAKLSTEKDRAIWLERTGGRFDSPLGTPSPLHNFAAHHIPFYFVQNHNSSDCLALIQHLEVHCLLNAGTPRKLTPEVLYSVPHGVINTHPGLLPQYRGCTAVEWAIFHNEQVGNTVHFMSEGYDQGPIITSEWYNFAAEATYQDIRSHVYEMGCILTAKVLATIQEQGLTPNDGEAQDESLAQYWDPIPQDNMNTVLDRIATHSYKYQCQ